MRRARDRIRHALLFELIGLAIVVPFGGALFHVSLDKFGVVGVVSTLAAMIWNYVYNLSFDHTIKWLFGKTEKSFQIRIVHAILFESGLLIILVPFIAWYLGVSMWQAFWMDITLTGFFLIYALLFNWYYDALFPIRLSE